MENNNINSLDTTSNSFEFSKFFFGRAKKTSNNKTVVIGVIDASGSMSSCWRTLVDEWNMLVTENLENTRTIIFSSDSHQVEGKFLTYSDVGGGTNICSGFTVLYNMITAMENEQDFTVIFVSDGDDGNMSTIKERIKKLPELKQKNVNLICVGVGSGFPTFVGMDLREKYHNGLSSIPAVFLVSDYKTEFASTFMEIKNNYISKLEKVKISPGVKRFPWTNIFDEEIFEMANFISLSPSVICNGSQLELESMKDLSKKRIEEIFKSWTQELQIMSIKGSVRNEAKVAVDFMEVIYKTWDAANNEVIDPKKLTVLKRLELRERKSGLHLLESLIGECKKMRDGVSLKDLSAEEAAKRLAIGTAQGKYHNRALQMRGLEQSEYEKFKQEFFEKLEKSKLSPETSQEASLILLQTQKEVFLESDLKTAVEQCNSYELVEVFPIVGHTLLIRRNDQSMINPYTVQVLSIPKINKVCDTLSLVTQGNEMEISIGNDDQEKFNAVLPLFDFSDSDMKSLIRSRLYHLLMTFNVMRNVDTFYYEAYAGLLANTFLRLLKYSESEWRTKMIDLVYSTFELVYGGNQVYEKSLELLLTQPRGALVTENEVLQHKCEDISKALLNLLVLKRRGKINEKESQEIIKYMLYEHIGRNLKEGTLIFESFLGSENDASLYDFKLKKSDSSKTKTDNNQHTETEKNNISESSTSNTGELPNIKINSDTVVNTNIKSENLSQSESHVIDINSPHVNSQSEEPMKLELIVEKFIKNREHLKFDSLGDLKKNLKKVFLDFLANSKSSNRMNIKLVRESFNKPGYRINFDLFYHIHDFFCPSLQFDEKVFLLCVNHAVKYKNSKDRCSNEFDSDFNKIYEHSRKEYFQKKERETQEKLLQSFEDPIIEAYLKDHKNAIKMIKDFNCNTELLKNQQTLDNNKPFVNVLFFGPHNSGKSSLVGRLMKELKCVDPKMYQHYMTAYKTFYPNRDNEPFEWISNLAADERSTDKTMGINVSHLHTSNKLVNIYDTPGKYQLYKHTLSAMSLVDYYVLCVEADLAKIKQEEKILLNSFCTILANSGIQLLVLLTKSDKVDNFVDVPQFENLFAEMMKKNYSKIKVSFLTVSAYSGHNIPELIKVLAELQPIEIKSDGTKLLVLDKISNQFDKKVVYVQSFGAPYESKSSFVTYPSMTSGKIVNCKINYEDVNIVKPRQYHTIKLDSDFDSLKIKRGSVLHINEKPPAKNTPVSKIREIIIKGNIYTKKINLKLNSCVKIEFKYFNETMQLINMFNEKGEDVKNSNDLSPQDLVTMVFSPTYACYFENIWIDKKSSEAVFLRGQHYSIIGAGKISMINYE